MTTGNTDELLARLAPHDPRRGSLLRCYAAFGVRFIAGRGWYRVSREIGEYLREVRQSDRDPHSPLAFEVCTEEEAHALDERDREDRGPRPASHPIAAEPRGPRVAAEPRRASSEARRAPEARKDEQKQDEPKKDA